MMQWVYGINAVEGLIDTQPQAIREAMVDRKREDKRIKRLISALKYQGVTVQFVDNQTLSKVTDNGSHQGIAVNFSGQSFLNENALLNLIETASKPVMMLVLDGVTDVHNFGAILRTAAAADVTAVIVPKDNTAPMSPVVRKVACGGAERVPVVQVTNLKRTLSSLQAGGLWVIGLAGDDGASSIYSQKLADLPVALVMGSEGKGMRRLTREACDELCYIPMKNNMESLNVSVAAAVCLYEIKRQSLYSKK